MIIYSKYGMLLHDLVTVCSKRFIENINPTNLSISVKIMNNIQGKVNY